MDIETTINIDGPEGDITIRLVGTFSHYTSPNPRETGPSLDSWEAFDQNNADVKDRLIQSQRDRAEQALYDAL